ncbi:Lytic polysaccharide monooxygenase [Pyrenophora tritici-repentis]|nr:Lytic polysaccharide monooxygenase [Pyrenophora tritici-repentis]
MLLTEPAPLGFVCTLLASTLAHVMLESPVPHGRPTLNNSPLDGTGVDFPCKLRAGVYDVTQMNYWTAGEAQTIRFIGSAVHGGGSCQFSVSEDLQPTKSSRWKVVHSVVGGCPASVEGNLLGGPASRVADTFEVVLPKELPSGKYTFAWTWFNRQGKREMYMNCAPITVRGGGNNTGFLASLPDMFVANLPSSACSTIENFDYAFPDPGSAVLTGSEANPTTGLVGAGCASMTALGSGSETARPADTLSNSSPGRQSMHTVLQEQPAVAASEITSANWLSSAAVKALAVGEMTASEFPASVAQSTQALTSQGSAPPAGAAASIPAASETCVPCNLANEVVCIDRDHYGLCDFGCAHSQLVAPGTVCTDGRILRREQQWNTSP